MRVLQEPSKRSIITGPVNSIIPVLHPIDPVSIDLRLDSIGFASMWDVDKLKDECIGTGIMKSELTLGIFRYGPFFQKYLTTPFAAWFERTVSLHPLPPLHPCPPVRKSPHLLVPKSPLTPPPPRRRNSHPDLRRRIHLVPAPPCGHAATSQG